MATTAGLVEPFKTQVEKLVAASAGKVTITSGFRTYAEQLALRKKNGCPDVLHSRPNDCRVATAVPGTSKHEKGQAVDFGGDLAWVAAHAAAYGLHRTVNVGTSREEMWHYELIPGFTPTPGDDDMGLTPEDKDWIQAVVNTAANNIVNTTTAHVDALAKHLDASIAAAQANILDAASVDHAASSAMAREALIDLDYIIEQSGWLPAPK